MANTCQKHDTLNCKCACSTTGGDDGFVTVVNFSVDPMLRFTVCQQAKKRPLLTVCLAFRVRVCSSQLQLRTNNAATQPIESSAFNSSSEKNAPNENVIIYEKNYN